MLRILVIVFASLLPCTLSFAADEKPSIKVGVMLSLSGGLEQWCGYIREGIELASAEEDAVRIQLIFEDDRSLDRKASLSAANKLLHVDKVDVLFSWTASAVPLLAPVAAAAKTPLVIGAYDQHVATAGPYVFGAFVNYDLVPREIARFLVQKNGAKRLALLMAADDWSQGFAKPFADELEKLGAQLVLSETVASDEKDLRGIVGRLNREKVDAVLAPLFANSLYSFLRQARELHYLGRIHVGDGMFEEDIKIAGPSAEGVYSSQIYLDDPAFAARLTRGGNPLQLGLAACGYDWIAHLQGTVRSLTSELRPITREQIRERLKTFSSTGLLGPQMYGTAPKRSGEVIMRVEGGKYVRVL